MAKKQKEDEEVVEEGDKTLNKVVKSGHKKFGGSFCIPLSSYKDKDRGIIRTLPSWDYALGGGLLRGQTCHLSAIPKLGKTTCALQIAQFAKNQFPNTKVFCYMVENRLSDSLLNSIDGLTRDNIYLIKSSEEKILTSVDYLQILESNIQDFPESFHIFDSIGALLGVKENDGDIGDAQVAETARYLQTCLKKITPLLVVHNATVLFINHEKQALNIGGHGAPKIVNPGGTYIQYAADTIIRLRFPWAKEDGDKREITDDNGEQIGHNVTFCVETTIMGKPKIKVTVPLLYGHGFDYMTDLFNLADQFGLITKGGAGWYTIGEEKVQGQKAVIAMMRENPEFFNSIKTKAEEIVYAKNA